MWLNLSDHLRQAVTKTMNRTSSQDALTVLFHSIQIGDLSGLLHIAQTLTALIVMRAAEVGDRRDKVWAVPFRKKLVHEPEMRTGSKPTARLGIGKPRLNHLAPHAIVSFG